MTFVWRTGEGLGNTWTWSLRFAALLLQRKNKSIVAMNSRSFVRDLTVKCFTFIQIEYVMSIILKDHQVRGKGFGIRCVLFCISKGYEGTESAHRHWLIVKLFCEHQNLKLWRSRFKTYNFFKNAKTDSVYFENSLIPHTSVNGGIWKLARLMNVNVKKHGGS